MNSLCMPNQAECGSTTAILPALWDLLAQEFFEEWCGRDNEGEAIFPERNRQTPAFKQENLKA